MENFVILSSTYLIYHYRLFPNLMKVAIISLVFAQFLSFHGFHIRTCNVKLPMQVFNLKKIIAFTKFWFPKRPLYKTYIFSACRSDLQIFWKRQRHRWHFCQLVKGVWYSHHTILLKKLEIYGITSANLA